MSSCCGGNRAKKIFDYLTYDLSDDDPRSVRIGIKAPILLRGLATGDKLVNSGKTIKLSAADVSKLQELDAPIWIVA